MANADIAGNGAVWVGLESSYGTPEDPTNAGVGVWVPIISETLAYTEDKYFSPQIRASAVVSDVEQSYYHAAGDIVMEVDAEFIPYFLAASRHKVTQGAAVGGVIPYTFEPTGIGSTYPGAVDAVGLSICVVRNDVGFLYSGCVVGQYAFTIDNGVLRVTCSMLGLAEQPTSDNDFSGMSWTEPDLFGASAHAVYVDAAGTNPAFATSDATFNGFTFTANYNAAAQNRLVPNRAATFVSYGEIEATYDTELDFTSRSEYDNMVANNLRALKFESLKGGTPPLTWATAEKGFRVIAYNTAYNTYTVGLSGIGDLLMAAVNGRCMGIAGGLPFKFEVKSDTDLGMGA